MNVPQWVRDRLPDQIIVSCSEESKDGTCVVQIQVKYAKGGNSPSLPWQRKTIILNRNGEGGGFQG